MKTTTAIKTAINTYVPTQVGTLALAAQGEGVPVVMWPSVFADHRLFALIVDQLGEGWRTIRVDGPGFGASTAPKGDEQTSDYADALIQVLDHLKLHSALFVGCSWGGQVTAHVAARHPERTQAALLANTPLGPSLGGHGFQVLGTRLIGSTAFWGRGVAKSMFSPTTMARYPERVRPFVDAFSSFDRAAASLTARSVLTRSPGLAHVLPRIRPPLTILMGAEDRLYPPEAMRPLAACAPNARIEIIDECGHLAPLEAPEQMASAIRNLVTAGPRDEQGDMP